MPLARSHACELVILASLEYRILALVPVRGAAEIPYFYIPRHAFLLIARTGASFFVAGGIELASLAHNPARTRASNIFASLELALFLCNIPEIEC